MIRTSGLIRFASIALVSVLASQTSAFADSYFEFYPRTITVNLYRGSGEFTARLYVAPRIAGTSERPAVVLSVNRLELHRINPGGLARVTWEFDLSDCDMRKQFDVEVELTGSNGYRTEEVDQNGNFTYYVGDVISAVNVDYKWLDNEASWQFTHGRRMSDGTEIPYVPPRFAGSPWTLDPQAYADGLREEARRLRELADQIEAAAADVDAEIERLQAERAVAENQEQLQSVDARIAEANELRRQADERIEELRNQADDLEHDAQAALDASDEG